MDFYFDEKSQEKVQAYPEQKEETRNMKLNFSPLKGYKLLSIRIV